MVRLVEPKVFLVGRPTVATSGMLDFLAEVQGGHEWWDRITNDDEEHEHAEVLIEAGGRLCYDSWTAGSLNPNVTKVREDSGQYFDNVVNSRHGSITEHSQFSFVLQNVSRVFTHEICRHRAGTAISQESMRFVRLVDIPFWFPDWASLENDPELFRRSMKLLTDMEEHQTWMAEHFKLDEPGVPFSVKKAKTSFMRRFAPDGVATRMLWSANLRALRWIVQQRTESGAEEEIRLVMNQIGLIMRNEAPHLFSDFEINEDGEWIPSERKI